MVPNVVCQQSFFYPPDAPRRLATALARRVRSVLPAMQRRLADASHLFNHPSLRLVGTHQTAVGIRSNVRQRAHALLQLRMAIEQL